MAERKYLGQDIHRMVSGDYKWRAFIADQWVQGRTLTELKDEMRRVCGKGKQRNGHTWFAQIFSDGLGPTVRGDSIVTGSPIDGRYAGESHEFPDGRRTVKLWREDIGRTSDVFRDTIRDAID